MLDLAGLRVTYRISWWAYPLIRICQRLNRLGVPITAERVADFVAAHGIHVVDR